ncbi:DMT family transporter [Sphingomonas chungangi]|nr:DMT family transporter [Sphingomonas chungangi]
MTDRPASPLMAQPIFEEEILPPGTEVIAPARSDAFAFVALLTGSTALAIGPWFVRMADVGPIASGFWRLALAIPFLFLIVRASKQRFGRQDAKLWAMLAIAGLFFAVDLALWHEGILRTKLANATLFGNVSSFFFAGYGFILARRLPNRMQACALVLAIVGIALLLGRSYELSRAHLVGDLLSIGAGLAYVVYMIAIERARTRLDTWPVLAIATVVGAICLLPTAEALDGSVLPHDWTPLLCLAIGSQVIGQGLVVFAMGRLSPVVVGIALLSQPLVSAIVGWVAYGERMTGPDIAGALALAAALVLIRGRD